ncbi:Putative protein virD4 [Magnetospirillum gryphiswaldense MSR-1 v2]|uniref:Uncharacterized protein n=1 Tax=Magnetospirillum gryphiswaldense (strain DSM 6361 / JCM 21280 / NBRC 15271 / MSR-1) TaxID=431944 RepID=V6F6K0_MAGGM|nr:type IV secretory system conjugative DNA transfer family protein [Magnetospirillum gryphiswaldense]CDL00997.1 Putative protein virD4 [Magnetospirillum gryphiswaldense MSR-1 v2]
MKNAPETLPEDGILVGYSLEHEHRTTPMGFSFGPPEAVADDRYLDPYMFNDGGHLITVAPTGAGKGVSCIIPTLLRFQGSVIVIDPKGENYAVTHRQREALGSEIHLLDPLGMFPDSPHRSSLNPLTLLDLDGMQAMDGAELLASLVTPVMSQKDPFWELAARTVLTGLILHYATRHEGGDLAAIRRDMLCFAQGEPNERLSAQHTPTIFDEMSQLLQTCGVRGVPNAQQLTDAQITELVAGYLADGQVPNHLPFDHEKLRALTHGVAQIDAILEELRLYAVFAQPDTEAEELPMAIKSLLASGNKDARDLGTFATKMADKTLLSVLVTLNQALAWAKGDGVVSAISSSRVNLQDVLDGKNQTIYIAVPSANLTSHAPLLRMWIATLIKTLSLRRTLPANRTLFMLDEAAQLGPLDDLRTAITLLRGYGVQTWSFWQDLSQLKLLYPMDWRSILNNCRVMQFFGPNSMMFADDIAHVVGNFTPGEVMALESDEMILAVSGDDPVIAQKPNYLTDPAFRGRYGDNPFFTAPNPPSRPKLSLSKPLRGRSQTVAEWSAGRREG